MLPTKNYIHFRGAEAVKVLVQAAFDPYAAAFPDQALVVLGGSTELGYKSVLDGSTHFGMVASEMGPQMERWAKRNGAKLTSTVVGFDGVAAYVHPQNPVDSLTIDNLHDIYTGTITNWSDLGGSDAPILALSQYPSTGSYTLWSKVVVGETGSVSARVKSLEAKPLLKQVAEVPNAIGFGAGGLVKGAVRVLKIGGVALNADNIKSAAYALRRPLMLAGDEALDPVARSFLDWFLDPTKGQKLIQSLGVVPVK